MRQFAIITAALFVATALAGCADDTSGTPTPATTTPATSTPPASTPATSTPVTSTPVTSTPAPEGDGEDGEQPSMLDCTEPAATTDAPGERMGYPEITFTVKEASEDDPCFGFVGPASVPAGWTVITLRNNGMQPHIMPMYQLGEGKTLEDFKTALMAEEPPTWLTPVGGVGVATPFSSGSSIIDLKPGKYVIVCFFAGHHVQGMYRVLDVTEAEGEARAEPTANYTVTLRDFTFDVPNMTAGTHVVKYVNEGPQPHEAPLIKLQGNATMMEFLQAIEGGAGGPPPGAGVGGVNELMPNGTAYTIVTLTAGNYGYVCFVEDHESHQPHIAKGMVTQFSVAEAPSE